LRSCFDWGQDRGHCQVQSTGCPQMKLTARQIDSAKPKEKSYKLADGGGMYLEIFPNGAKSWRLKYRIAGKEKRV